MWTYIQKTGELLRGGAHVATGYSGRDAGKNNPAMQHVPQVGPIPCGRWRIGTPRDTEYHGPHVLPLEPQSGTPTFGRSGFLIHGDSVHAPGTASHGCMIQARAVRELISSSGDAELEVLATKES